MHCSFVKIVTDILFLYFNNRFVRVEYKPCHSLDNLVQTFTEETNKIDGNQFVEGLMYSLNSGVVMTCNMATSAEPGKVNFFFYWVVK